MASSISVVPLWLCVAVLHVCIIKFSGHCLGHCPGHHWKDTRLFKTSLVEEHRSVQTRLAKRPACGAYGSSCPGTSLPTETSCAGPTTPPTSSELPTLCSAMGDAGGLLKCQCANKGVGPVQADERPPILETFVQQPMRQDVVQIFRRIALSNNSIQALCMAAELARSSVSVRASCTRLGHPSGCAAR